MTVWTLSAKEAKKRAHYFRWNQYNPPLCIASVFTMATSVWQPQMVHRRLCPIIIIIILLHREFAITLVMHVGITEREMQSAKEPKSRCVIDEIIFMKYK